tara:strand:- start:919 stop:1188 length:270 start_codon:yes stop_codon:yes gene_type:complete
VCRKFPKALGENHHMQIINHQHEGYEKEKLIFIPWSNCSHVIVYKTNRSYSAKKEEDIHDDEKDKTCAKARFNCYRCGNKLLINFPVFS